MGCLNIHLKAAVAVPARPTAAQAGYRIEIVFLQLSSPRLALKRIASRVAQGGHDVPRTDVLRRFARGLVNFRTRYQPLADSWALYDNSGASPVLLAKGP
jgi:predicted ABC-type ATPase